MSKGKGFDLKNDVLAELEWDPQVDASKIGVTAEDGVVTLTGHAGSFTEKWNAEKIAKRVYGVKAVANDIEVRLDVGNQRDDTEIAQSALNALNWNFSVPSDCVTVTVSKGWVTLEGQVEWNYQKLAAETAIRHLRGIRGVSNLLTMMPHVKIAEVKNKIEAALSRNAELDAKNISVETRDGIVTLQGKVRSWAEHDDAVNAAWAAPGVTKVVDRISIQPRSTFTTPETFQPEAVR